MIKYLLKIEQGIFLTINNLQTNISSTNNVQCDEEETKKIKNDKVVIPKTKINNDKVEIPKTIINKITDLCDTSITSRLNEKNVINYCYNLQDIILSIVIKEYHKAKKNESVIDLETIKKNIEIEDSGDINNNNMFEYIFVAQPLERNDITYELIVQSNELKNINSLFLNNPNIFLSMVKNKPDTIVNNIKNNNDNIVIKYKIEIFDIIIPINIYLQIKKHSVLEPQQIIIANLKKEIDKLQKEVIEFKSLTNEIKNDQNINCIQKEIIDNINNEKHKIVIIDKKNKHFENNNIENNENENEKNVRIVPYDRLVTTEENAHYFLINYYCCDEYKEYITTKKNMSIQEYVEGFLGTRCKKLLFNMHYINRIEKLKFISVFEYNTNIFKREIETSAIDNEGLGFYTIQTNKVFSYQKYDKTIKNELFDKFFVLNWINTNPITIPHGQLILNGDEPFTVLYSGGTYCYYLRIVQCETN